MPHIASQSNKHSMSLRMSKSCCLRTLWCLYTACICWRVCASLKYVCVFACICVQVKCAHIYLHLLYTHIYLKWYLFIFACTSLFICVRVSHLGSCQCQWWAATHTQDMTAEWQTDHQHSSWQPQRTLSGSQGEFIEHTGVIKVSNLLCGHTWRARDWLIRN